MSSNLPINCLRGIPNRSNNYFQDDGKLAAPLFYFKDDHPREDQWIEQSINWDDDDKAVEFTLNQKREDGELQFAGGAAILSRYEIDHFSQLPTINGILSYERRAIDGNAYHGNLLLHKNVSKPTMKMVASFLALISEIA